MHQTRITPGTGSTFQQQFASPPPPSHLLASASAPRLLSLDSSPPPASSHHRKEHWPLDGRYETRAERARKETLERLASRRLRGHEQQQITEDEQYAEMLSRQYEWMTSSAAEQNQELQQQQQQQQQQLHAADSSPILVAQHMHLTPVTTLRPPPSGGVPALHLSRAPSPTSPQSDGDSGTMSPPDSPTSLYHHHRMMYNSGEDPNATRFPVMSPKLKIPSHFDASVAINPTYTSSYFGVHRGAIGVLAVKHPIPLSSTGRSQYPSSPGKAGGKKGGSSGASKGKGARPLTGAAVVASHIEEATKNLTPFSREMWRAASARDEHRPSQHPPNVKIDPDYRAAGILASGVEGWGDGDLENPLSGGGPSPSKGALSKSAGGRGPISPLAMEDPERFSGTASPVGADAPMADNISVMSGVSSAVSFTANEMRPIQSMQKKKATIEPAPAVAARTRTAQPSTRVASSPSLAPVGLHVDNDAATGRVSQSTLGHPTPDLYDVWVPNNALPAARGLTRAASASALGARGAGGAVRPPSAGGGREQLQQSTRAKTSAPIPYVVHSAPMGWKLTTPARKRFVEAAALLAGMGENEPLPMPDRLSELPESLGLPPDLDERVRRGLAGPAPRQPLTTKVRQAVRRRHTDALATALDRVRLGTGGGNMRWMGREAHERQLKKIDTKIKMNVTAANRPQTLAESTVGFGSNAIGRRFRCLSDDADEELGNALETLRAEQKYQKDRGAYAKPNAMTGPQSWGVDNEVLFNDEGRPFSSSSSAFREGDNFPFLSDDPESL